MDVGKDLQRAFDDGYSKAIDEFSEECKRRLKQGELYDYVKWCNWNDSAFKWFDKIAEQMKQNMKQ